MHNGSNINHQNIILLFSFFLTFSVSFAQSFSPFLLVLGFPQAQNLSLFFPSFFTSLWSSYSFMVSHITTCEQLPNDRIRPAVCFSFLLGVEKNCQSNMPKNKLMSHTICFPTFISWKLHLSDAQRKNLEVILTSFFL